MSMGAPGSQGSPNRAASLVQIANMKDEGATSGCSISRQQLCSKAPSTLRCSVNQPNQGSGTAGPVRRPNAAAPTPVRRLRLLHFATAARAVRLHESWDATFYGRHVAYSTPAGTGPGGHQQLGSDVSVRLFARTGPKQTQRCRGRRPSSCQALEPGMLGECMRRGAAAADSRSWPCCHSEQRKSCWPTARAMLRSTSFPNLPSLQASRYPAGQHL